MNSKMWLMNLVLLGIAAIFWSKAYGVWSHRYVMPGEERGAKPVEKSVVTTHLNRKRVHPVSYYDVVVKKNLFSPDRSVPEEESPTEEVIKEIPALPEKIFLYGVILMNGYETALVSNPSREPGARKEVWVKVGDSLGDLKVLDIKKERIVLEREGKPYDVLLYAKNKPRTKIIAPKTAEPKVVTAGKEKPAAAQKISKPKELPRGSYKVIKTPFGEVKRKK
jgi:hypothetical protein